MRSARSTRRPGPSTGLVWTVVVAVLLLFGVASVGSVVMLSGQSWPETAVTDPRFGLVGQVAGQAEAGLVRCAVEAGGELAPLPFDEPVVGEIDGGFLTALAVPETGSARLVLQSGAVVRARWADVGPGVVGLCEVGAAGSEVVGPPRTEHELHVLLGRAARRRGAIGAAGRAWTGDVQGRIRLDAWANAEEVYAVRVRAGE